MSFLDKLKKGGRKDDGLPDFEGEASQSEESAADQHEPRSLGEQLARTRAERQAAMRPAAEPIEASDMPKLGRSGMGQKTKVAIAVLAVLLAGAAIVAMNFGSSTSTPEERAAKKKEKEAAEKQVANKLPPLESIVGRPPAPPAGARAAAGAPAGAASAGSPVVPGIQPGAGGMPPGYGQAGSYAVAPKAPAHWSDRKREGAMLVGTGLGGLGGASAAPATATHGQPMPFGAAGMPGQAAPAAFPGAVGQGASTVGGASGGQTALGAALVPTVARATTASQLGDRNFLLTKGTSLDCALETALQSNLPGLVTCRLTRDVYSDNGQVLLLDRGSRLVGEYQGGVKQGQVRVFVLWSRAQTPNGVVINLNSPGIDPLGRAGLDGWVDNHFAERFGAAIMLSLVQDVVSSASRSGVGSTTNNYYGNTVEAGSKIVEKMLDQTVNIPPTIVKNQGEHVQVMLARDLDFSSVYALRLKP